MAALVISISSDLSAESVGSLFPRVILIGSISVEIPVAPEVGAAVVASPAKVLELDTHSSSKADPSESLLPPVSIAHMVSPFLCSNDLKSDTEISERHASPTTSIPKIPSAPILPAPSASVGPSSEFPLALVVAPPDILFLLRALTIRKSVRPLPSHRLASRYTSHHLDHFTSGSSSSHSSSDHSSSSHPSSGHSLSGHTSPDTTIADSSTPLIFVHPSLARTPQCSEAYLYWRSTPLSTMYLPMTFESSAGYSSSESSAGPSRKRCRSSGGTMISSILATRALGAVYFLILFAFSVCLDHSYFEYSNVHKRGWPLVPSRADLLLPRKRFRDSISPKDSVQKGINTDVLEDIEADVTAVKSVLWWGKDSRTKRDRMVVQEVGLKGGEG
nr:hypothetical protein [Tanacetum cinerariifolium]